MVIFTGAARHLHNDRRRLMGILSKLFSRFTKKKKDDVLDNDHKININIIDQPGPDSLSFNLIVGFDVGVDQDIANINVHINTLMFTSNCDKSKAFIQGVPEETLKSTVSTLCYAVSKHVMQNQENVKFARTTIPGSDIPPDKTHLN